MAKGDFTKAKSITPKTKEKVFERQKGRSVLSGLPISKEMCCCHFIGRGVSGVGYEWNIVGLTPDEHRDLDLNKPILVNGSVRFSNEEAQIIIANHLKMNYNNWSIDKCKYKKYYKESDYEVTRMRIK